MSGKVHEKAICDHENCRYSEGIELFVKTVVILVIALRVSSPFREYHINIVRWYKRLNVKKSNKGEGVCKKAYLQ